MKWVGLAAVMLAAAAPAAQAPAASTAFRYERPVAVAVPGPQRLAIDPALLEHARSFSVGPRTDATTRPIASNGLADLRLFDTSGHELPYLLVNASDTAPAVTIPVEFTSVPSEPGHSRFHLTLPAPHLPLVTLDVEAMGAHVFSTVTASESRLSGWQAQPVTLGRSLFIRDDTSAVASIAPYRLNIDAPSSSEIDLLVADERGAATLDMHRIAAECAALPWIYFKAEGPVIARFGNDGLRPPSYDLEPPQTSLESVPEAKWASSSATRIAGAEPLAAPGGAAIDVSTFLYSRAIQSDGPGLAALPLDADVLAHSAGPRQQFRDIRIVDASGQQIPWLPERRPEPLVIEVKAKAAKAEARDLEPRAGANRSIYQIDVPPAAVADTSVVITAAPQAFRRRIELGVERQPDRSHRDPWFLRLAAVDWTLDEKAIGLPILTIPLEPLPRGAAQLLLVVDEGDNSPLPITSVHLLLPSYRLRFFAPAAATRLVYGDPSARAPEYDLTLLAERVLGSPARAVTMAPEHGGLHDVARLVSTRTFWIALAVAVVVLLGLLVVLLRRAT